MDPSGFVVGSVIAGRYRVARVLGRGGMGMVLEVTHVQLGGRHALKLLHAEHATDVELVTRFENEAKIAATMRSDHLVRVTDMGRLDTGEPFLVMDYLEGADIDQLLEKHTLFPIGTSVSWILQACVGLAHLHAAGFVHRDIKPSNLFWSQEPDGRQVIKVLDFGLAKMPTVGGQRITATTANFGTPQFMAPEQIMSAKHVDARCDQHALGLVLYELLVGEPAFPGETAGAITVAIATQPAPRPSERNPDVPRTLDAAIARALAKRPNDRFPNLSDFAMALVPFGGSEGIELARATAKLLGGAAGATDPVYGRPGEPIDEVTDAVSSPSEVGPTLVRRPDITSTGLVTNTKTGGRKRARWWLPLGAALAGGMALGAVFALRSEGSTLDEGESGTVTSSTMEASATPAATAMSTAAPIVVTMQEISAGATATSSVAGAAPSASVSTRPGAFVRRPPTARPAATQRPTASQRPTGSIFEKYK